jgi:potassium-transporting ATPase KdpC subunit
MSFWSQLRKSFMAMVLFSIILGGVYPLAMAGLGKLLFPKEVSGSLITNTQGEVIGSSLIGQNFQNPKYFFSRPSATSPAYNPLASGGSNLSPTNPQLINAMKARVTVLLAQDSYQKQLIPIDLITSSVSGLDPDISVASAYYQAPRIAKLRNLSIEQVDQLIAGNVTERQLGILGEPRVNVLKLNMALDNLKS